MRLDRFLTKHTRTSGKAVRQLLLDKRVRLNGEVVTQGVDRINEFSRIEIDGEIVQGEQARYYMLHKPKGVVSATEDTQHRTVLDLFPQALRRNLHIGGRLDLNTTGLMLITNDGRWSRRLTQPEKKVPKVYLVETEDPIGAEYAGVFQRGIYFAYEDLTTQPAQLEILAERRARLTIHEGRYHQVKRMFGYFNNKVIGLHREQVGELILDAALAEGEYRALSPAEVALF